MILPSIAHFQTLELPALVRLHSHCFRQTRIEHQKHATSSPMLVWQRHWPNKHYREPAMVKASHKVMQRKKNKERAKEVNEFFLITCRDENAYKFTIIIQKAHSFGYLVQPPSVILIPAIKGIMRKNLRNPINWKVIESER